MAFSKALNWQKIEFIWNFDSQNFKIDILYIISHVQNWIFRKTTTKPKIKTNCVLFQKSVNIRKRFEMALLSGEIFFFPLYFYLSESALQSWYQKF
jgi:hypothetical protein